MATQLAFSRQFSPSSRRSNGSVTPYALSSRLRTDSETGGGRFAVHTAREEPQRRHVAFTVPASRQPTAASRRPRKKWAPPATAIKPKVSKPRRRPAWESDARQGSSLFDATLKKTVLFQPNAREKQAQVVAEQRKAAAQKRSSPAPHMARAPRTTEAERRRFVSSSAKPQQLRRRRPEQDFVRRNIEQITGRSYSQYTAAHSLDKRATQPRGNVFERLSRPQIDLSLVRRYSASASAEPVEQSPLQIKSSSPSYEESRSSPVLSNRRSPATTRSPPRLGPNQHENDPSPRSSRPLNSPRRSPSTTPLDIQESSVQHESSVAAKVFDMLDEKQKGRIGVNQILHGLRFLGLPATHNQVSY